MTKVIASLSHASQIAREESLMTLYTLALFVHIAAAAHLIGTSLLSPLVVHRVRTAQTHPELLQWLGFARQAMRFNPLSALILLGTGAWLGASGWWTTGWFAVSVFAWLLSSAMAGAVIKPAAQRIAQSGDVRSIGRWTLAEKVLLGSDAAMLWIMIAKPALVASIAILVGAIALFVVVPQAAASLRRSTRSLPHAEANPGRAD